MKLINYIIAIYSFISSAVFAFLAFFSLFSNFIVDWMGFTILFIFPMSFSILLYYVGFGLWNDRKWAHLLGGPVYLGLGISNFIASCELRISGIVFIAVSIYFFWLASKDLKG